MRLPGLDRLALLSPDFARAAKTLGTAAWGHEGRSVRETTAAFLGCDLALGLLDLPLTLHATMARQLGVSDAYLVDLVIGLAPNLGYPVAAQALTNLASQSRDALASPADLATPRELRYAVDTAAAVLGRGRASNTADIVAEYGSLRQSFAPDAPRTAQGSGS